MNKMRLFLITVTLLFYTGAFASEKVDPLLAIMATAPKASLNTMKAFGTKAMNGLPMSEALIKADEGHVFEARTLIETFGGQVKSVIGNIMTARIPLEAVQTLAESDFIERIEAAKPVRAKMNYARTATGVDEVQAGTCTGCGSGYTGSGVIVGIVDSGIDCDHADFQDGSGNTRIIAYWDQSISGSGVPEIPGSTGKLYTGTELSDGTCTASSDDSGHGTHVSGIAAGSNATYTGVANESNIIFVKYGAVDADSSGTLSTYILEAVNYIFLKATSLGNGKSAVVNLSLGTSLGAHDGTSLLEEGLDNLTLSGAHERSGRVIVNAAGNERLSIHDTDYTTLGGIHAGISVASGEDKGYEFQVRNSSTAIVSYGGVVLDLWLDSSSTCTVQIDGFSSTTGAKLIDMDPVSFGSSGTATDGSATVTLNFTETADSGKKHGSATLNRASISKSSSILNSYYFHLILSGNCSGDAWLYPDQTSINDFTKVKQVTPSGYTYVAGNSAKTTTIPGTARCVITAGSFMDKATWIDMNDTTHYQTATSGTDYTLYGATGGTAEDISLFSSLGPTADSRTKPDISAPGEPIISTLASTVSEASAIKGDATHLKMEGTSMASPHVAGTVALMLQKNNCLTATMIKGYLANSATKDSYTGTSLPDDTWGNGKLNAASAMGQFDSSSSCTPGDANTSSGSCYVEPPQPSGSSGCGSIMNGVENTASRSSGVTLLGVVFMAFVFYQARRKRNQRVK